MYDWQTLYLRFEHARSGESTRNEFDAPESARDAFAKPSVEDLAWLTSALRDESRKWLVAALSRGVAVPEPLFEPMINAGIDEVNPSLNRDFIEPCKETFGARRVNEHLLDVIEKGDGWRKAGAVNALYWAQVPLIYIGNVAAHDIEHATPESREHYLSLNDIWQRKRVLLLNTFISSTNVDVQRSIIPSLNLRTGAYPAEYAERVERAIEIGSTHADEYIRHRTSVQLGTEKRLRPLPHRGPQESS